MAARRLEIPPFVQEGIGPLKFTHHPLSQMYQAVCEPIVSPLDSPDSLRRSTHAQVNGQIGLGALPYFSHYSRRSVVARHPEYPEGLNRTGWHVTVYGPGSTQSHLMATLPSVSGSVKSESVNGDSVGDCDDVDELLVEQADELAEAVQKGLAKTVHMLIESGYSPNTQNSKGQRVCHVGRSGADPSC